MAKTSNANTPQGESDSKPESQEAPAITLESLAGMVTDFAGNVSKGMADMGERLAKLESQPAQAANAQAAVKAAKVSASAQVDAIEDPALHALRGVCSMAQQQRAEGHFAKGKANLAGYISEKLEQYAKPNGVPSRAMAYSKALLVHAK